MSDHATFLRAIIAAPDDDMPRLVYADWLDERGDPRGEFIRVQIALAGWPCECDSEERVYHDECRCGEKAALQRRERKLLEPNWPRWSPWVWGDTRYCNNLLPGPTPLVTNGVYASTFRRGFVEAVTCTLADWVGGPCPWCRMDGTCPRCHGTGRVGGHGPAVVRACPVREVRLSDAHDVLFRWEVPRMPSGIRLALMLNDRQDVSAACIAWAKAEADRADCQTDRYGALLARAAPTP